MDKLMPIDNLEELSISVYFTAVDLKSGKELYYSSGKVPEICMASSALIPLFPPVEYDGLMLADGGLVNHMPIKPLQEYSYPIIGVNLHPITHFGDQNNFFSFIVRAVYLKMYSNSQDSQNKCDIFITNDKLRDYSLFSFKHLDEMFEMGYSDAEGLLDIYATIPN